MKSVDGKIQILGQEQPAKQILCEACGHPAFNLMLTADYGIIFPCDRCGQVYAGAYAMEKLLLKKVERRDPPGEVISLLDTLIAMRKDATQ